MNKLIEQMEALVTQHKCMTSRIESLEANERLYRAIIKTIILESVHTKETPDGLVLEFKDGYKRGADDKRTIYVGAKNLLLQ